ncbi:MAG: nicotinamide riboside transporter PnuC [Caulobacter sp.]|jgi:nicotinamide mononucleotide transporter
MTPLELAAAAFSALSVLFTVRRSLWLWPAGIVGTALYLVVFLQARLYGSVALQVFFLAIQLYGWWWWLRGDKGGEPAIRRLSGRAMNRLLIVASLAIVAVAVALEKYTDAQAPRVDTAIMVLSICAQWLLSRKLLQNWWFWLGVDVLAVGHYGLQGLYVTAGLYALFLVMAGWGLWEWRRAFKAQGPLA